METVGRLTYRWYKPWGQVIHFYGKDAPKHSCKMERMTTVGKHAQQRELVVRGLLTTQSHTDQNQSAPTDEATN